MATFKLDGEDITFEPGDTVIRAAWRAGREIPHYCWHPGLSVAANCRMCLVEITSGRKIDMPILKWDAKKSDYVPATKPKLQPACQFQASEGLEVSSKSEPVKQAQGAVQEFLLLNHPVDCPICDQAGECKLQDYYLEHQGTPKRKLTEPVHKPKGVRFGPTIVYDAERCIMCTRCIRVCDELAGDHVLDMRERGNRNEIVLAPGRELDHKYSLMTEHVCPVGALTSRDFRFKARVWFLKSAPGVCNGCSKGCNTHVDFDPRYGKVYRLRPRDNMDVNKFWMCDDGLMTYEEAHDNRLFMGRVGRGEAGDFVGAADAIAEAAQALKSVDGNEIAVVLSAQNSTEDNYALARLGRALGATRQYLAAKGGWEGDDILREADNNPNRAGATAAAGSAFAGTVSDLAEHVASGDVRAVLALGSHTAADTASLAKLEGLERFICLASNGGGMADAAQVAIPIANWAEAHGSFTNSAGTNQPFKRAIPAAPGIEPGWRAIASLAAALGHDLGFHRVQDVRAAMKPASADSDTTEARA
jgi:NADH-quinone oxidoreductase subunit G